MKNLNRKKAFDLLRTAGITEPPIDLEKIAKLLGFNILSFPFPESRKGTVLIEEGVRAIGVNESYSDSAQRFTIAHEIGHFVNGHQHVENTFSNDNTRFYSRYFQQEREADLFASELLMPKDFLIQDIAMAGLDLDKLRKKYLVSEEAMRIRLKTLRLGYF